MVNQKKPIQVETLQKKTHGTRKRIPKKGHPRDYETSAARRLRCETLRYAGT
jgi:hypothetical protein